MLLRPSSIDQLTECLDGFKQLRTSQPVWYDEETNSWHLVCYQEVLQVFADTSSYALQDTPGIPPADFTAAGRLIPQSVERLLARVLTPRSVSELSSPVTEITCSLVSGLRSSETIDIIEDFAAPLASSAIAELLGIPGGQRASFIKWVSERKNTSKQAAEGVPELFRELIAQRRLRPGQDIISMLLGASPEYPQATEAEIAGCLLWLVDMGHDMVTHLLGNAVLCLTMHPDVITRLRQDRVPVYSTVEEILRFLPPVWMVPRTAAHEVTLRSHRISPGARICAWIVSANRDDGYFSSPDTFDIERIPNRHLSFGYGHHFHFDAALARLLAEVSLTELTGQLPGLRLLPVQRLEVVDNPAIFGVQHLYVACSPASASSASRE